MKRKRHAESPVLPEEVLLDIYNYCDLFDVIRAAAVTKQWQRAAKHPSIWKKLTIKCIKPKKISTIIKNYGRFIQELTISRTNVTQYLIEQIYIHCDSLYALDISGAWGNSATNQTFFECVRDMGIIKLILPNNSKVQQFVAIPTLRILHVTNNVYLNYRNIELCHNLRELSVSDCRGFTNNSLRSVTQLRLKYLDVSYTVVTSTAINNVSYSEAARCLEVFLFNGVRLSAAQLTTMAQRIDKLKSLSLSHVLYGNYEFSTLRYFKNVEDLYIGSMFITTQHVAMIDEMNKLEQICFMCATVDIQDMLQLASKYKIRLYNVFGLHKHHKMKLQQIGVEFV